MYWEINIEYVENMELDTIDKKIIGILQKDSTMAVQAIADLVGLTVNPCWRRIKRLESDGVILGRVAVINSEAIGLGMTAFVRIHTDNHTKTWLKGFHKAVQRIPEIVECHRMTGDVDYLLKVLVRDLKHYDKVYQHLLELVPDLSDVSSAFSMESLKGNAVIDPFTSDAPN